MRGDVSVSKQTERNDLGVYPEPPGQLHLPLERETDKTVLDKAGLLQPSKASGPHRSTLQTALETHFGTPAAPKLNRPITGKGAERVFAENDADEVKAALERLVPLAEGSSQDKELAEGSKLYRRHCLHCHGISGDGRGPTGP